MHDEPIRVAIIDDEAPAIEKLECFLANYEDVRVVGSARTAAKAISLIETACPDVVFIDIRLPDADGLSIADQVRSESGVGRPCFIVNTAYDSYALQAFDARAVDYLLKPYTRERFCEAMNRARRYIQAERSEWLTSRVAQLVKTANKPKHLERLMVRNAGKITFLGTKEIHYIRAEDNYLRIFEDKESHLLRGTLSAMEEQLNPRHFLRIHRSILVNTSRIREILLEADEGDSKLLLKNGVALPLTRTYRAQVLHTLSQGQ